jgi:hypothetical protein
MAGRGGAMKLIDGTTGGFAMGERLDGTTGGFAMGERLDGTTGGFAMGERLDGTDGFFVFIGRRGEDALDLRFKVLIHMNIPNAIAQKQQIAMTIAIIHTKL